MSKPVKPAKEPETLEDLPAANLDTVAGGAEKPRPPKDWQYGVGGVVQIPKPR